MRPRIAALVVSLLVAVPASLPATQKDPRLDALFEELQSLDKRRDRRAGELQARIWAIWYQHDDAAVNAAMETGLEALTQDRFRDAVDAFTRVVELDPEFAEGWNRRGTAYYLLGRYRESLADIARVLELEPRHFAAIQGRGLCLRELGRPRAAIDALEAALAINPHLDNAYLEILRLRSRIDEPEPESI